MRLTVWWAGLSRAYQNAIVLFFADLLFFIGALLNWPFLHATWESLTDAIPNIFEAAVWQLIGLFRDVFPGVIIANAVLITYGTLFFSLLLIHLLVGFGIGFLFDHTERNLWHSFANFFTVILVLFLLHFFLLFDAAGLI